MRVRGMAVAPNARVYRTLIYMSLLGAVQLIVDKPIAAALCFCIGLGDVALRSRRSRANAVPPPMRERREERRLPGDGLRARVRGPVSTVATVIDLSRSGALLAPWARLPRGT